MQHRAELRHNVWLTTDQIYTFCDVLDCVLLRVVIELAAKDQIPVWRGRESGLGKVDPLNVAPASVLKSVMNVSGKRGIKRETAAQFEISRSTHRRVRRA